jgi:signal transduction histidine kinase
MNFRQKLIAYAKLPEMRIAWYFLIVCLIQIISFLLWPPFIFALILATSLLLFFVAIAWTAVHLARTNFALQLEKNQNAAIIAGFSEGIIAYDKDFRIWSINHAAEIICGIRKEEVIDQKVTPEWGSNPRFQIITQILFPSLAAVITKKTVATYPQVIGISFSQPREIHLEITTNQIFDDKGKLLGFLKVIRDRSREVELLKMKTEFITVAAHQLRTPLSGVKWALESLQKGDYGTLEQPQENLLKETLRMTEKLVKLIDDLLDVARLEEGKFGYEFEKSDILTLIQEILEQVEQLANERGIRLAFFKPETPLPPILMDKRRIGLVLQNLLNNAIKYNVKNGEVRVKVELLKDRPYVQISIEDTGVGIPEKDLPRIFSKFFRSENIMQLETEGSGLGLYIARNIVKRHGGEIWFKSVEKRGSTFYFVLPTDESLIPPVEVVAQETI